LELDEQAEIISYEEYYPYGTSSHRAVKKDTEASSKRYRFSGMEKDEESGLGYHGARYYAPFVARWSACDPVAVADGLNLYAYSQGNPVNLTDTDGQQSGSPSLSKDTRDRALSFAGGIYGAGKSLLGGFTAAFKVGYYSMGSNMYFFTGDSMYQEQDAQFRAGYHSLEALLAAKPSDIAQGYIKARGDAVTEAADRDDPFAASEAASETAMDLLLLADAAGSSTPRLKFSFEPAMLPEFGFSGGGSVSVSLLGPKDLAKGIYVMASLPDKVKENDLDSQGARDVKAEYLRDQGVSSVKELPFKSYWNLMEKLGVDALVKQLGVIVYEQIHLFEATVQGGRSVLSDLGRIPDALLVDPTTGQRVVSEFTAMKDIPVGSAKYEQMAGQLSAFDRARSGSSAIWARLPNGSYMEVTEAVQTLGSYPHWDAANVAELGACF
jgi:RHS repeat-associated protein